MSVVNKHMLKVVKALGFSLSVAAMSWVGVSQAQTMDPKDYPDEHQTKQEAINNALPGKPDQAAAALLASAFQAKRYDLLEQLVASGIAIDTPLIGDGTLLIQAVAQGNLQAVTRLLDMGANPDAISEGDGNPLIVAAKYDAAEIAQLLITRGASVDAQVEGDETALITASRFNSVAVAEVLLQAGADANLAVMADGNRLRTPLNQTDDAKMIALLKENGAE